MGHGFGFGFGRNRSLTNEPDEHRREEQQFKYRFQRKKKKQQQQQQQVHSPQAEPAPSLSPAAAGNMAGRDREHLFASHSLSLPQSATILAAKEHQQRIHKKLEKAHIPIPRYEFKDLIGKGSYGKVYLAKDLDHDRMAAVKVIDADAVDYLDAPHDMREQTMKDFHHEVKLLSTLKEQRVPNINTIYDVFVLYDQLWIVAEYCAGGSVHTLMHASHERLDEKYIIPIVREVCKGVAKIHAADIIHRDIKAANVMITETGSVQIIDFGVAASVEPRENKRATFIGTMNWMAPEFFKRDPSAIRYDQSVDVWAIGCTIYEMVKGQPPNARIRNKRQLGSEIARNPPRLSPSDGVSAELCAFVEYILQPDASLRPLATDLLEHPYLKGTEKTHPTTTLVDLVIRFTNWEHSGGARVSLMMPNTPNPGLAAMPSDEDHQDHPARANQDDWRFSIAPTDPAEVDAMLAIARAESQDGTKASYDAGGKPSMSGSTTSTMPANFDQRAARRGQQHLAGIFTSQSDLPLRNTASSSDVRSKEVFAPDPSQPRILGAGSIPDIGSVNMDTIKQNRLLTRSGTNGPSDSSSDDLAEAEAKNPKRSTMAWTPNWNETVTSAQDDQYNDPFGGFAGFPSSSTSHLAPPTPSQRPGLHQANTAPGEIPTTATMSGGAGVRASTASVLDMDALMGEDLMPSSGTSYSFGGSSPAQQPSGGESMTSPDNFEELSTGEMVREDQMAPSIPGVGPVRPQQPSPPSPDDQTGGAGYRSRRPVWRQPPQPPSERVMGPGASSAEMAAELSRLMGGLLGEVSGLVDDLEAEVEAEYADIEDLEEETGDEAYDGGKE